MMSFVILTRRRPGQILRCLESLGNPHPADVWLAFNGPDRNCELLLKEISSRYPWTRILKMERTSRGEARNLVIKKTSGRIVYFLDDDTVVPKGFAGHILEKFSRYPGTPSIGGPNICMPNPTPFQRAVDFLFRSPLGAGPMRIRYRRTGKDRPLPSWCFTLANLGVRREVFERHRIYFPKNCTSAEENLFLFHVERRLGPAVYSPDLHVYHERRNRLGGFCRQVFRCGKGRMQITLLDLRSLQPVVLLPVCFLVYLICLPFLFRAAWLFAPAMLYTAGCAAESLRLAFFKRDPLAALWLPLAAFLGHISYAVGFLAGVLFRRSDS